MAIIQCPDCGRDVSSEAPLCPGCGRPIKVTEDKQGADEGVEYEYMTRRIVTHFGEANLVQMEVQKWAKQGWELHQQSQGQWALDGGPMTLLTFRRPKKEGNPPVPTASCCVIPATLVLVMLAVVLLLCTRIL